MEFSYQETIQLLLSLLIGGMIGIEREYSSKAAGFRTMILISVGSTLFTIISRKLGAPANEDRIAANIITGIGFIGAGVVFKDGFSVTGLTTAASIWVTAALGMAIGSGDYVLAGEGTILTIIILFLFEYIQLVIDRMHQRRTYKISFQKDRIKIEEIRDQLRSRGLKFIERSETKHEDDIRFSLDVLGSQKKVDDFNKYLMNSDLIKSFDC
ncbi:MAG: MgtC/SapB family protein [Bacteroidetes bacterium]|nr:MgtC/SapB family protein [Bacteroidota bacterium]